MVLGADVTTWIPGWFSLFAVSAYGALLISQAIRTQKRRDRYKTRILVTGSRGKSGTVRLVHAGISALGKPAYGKVTGSTAVELLPDGSEVPTFRLGRAGVSEMLSAVIRGAKLGAGVGIFECMAITPKLIHTVQAKYVRADIVVIPTIRLDHLEEEGLTELEIGRNTLAAIPKCKQLVTAVDQPELIEHYQTWCNANQVEFVHVVADETTPVVLGHHITNVAIAMAVLKLLGYTRKEAVASVTSASKEPGAISYFRIKLADGSNLSLVDVGGANDPQSSAEAVSNWGLDQDSVVPILNNRWERPLRSVVFTASLLGSYPLVLVTGTLFRWSTKVNNDLQRENPLAATSDLVFLNKKLSSQPELLAATIRKFRPELNGCDIYLVLTANVHESTGDLLRRSFAKKGEEVFLEAES